MAQTTTQEHKRNLNEMVTKYKETGDEVYFEKAFALAARHLRQTASKWSASCGIPFEDLLSEGNYRFTRVVESYSIGQGDFVNLLSRTLSNSYTMMIRSPDNKKDYTERYLEMDDKEIDVFEDVIISGITKDASAEAESLVFSKERSEMLTSLLVDVDDKMQQAINAYLATGSFRKAGLVLGISHMAVKRRIESLSRKFDASKYGNPRDYLEGVETIVQ